MRPFNKKELASTAKTIRNHLENATTSKYKTITKDGECWLRFESPEQTIEVPMIEVIALAGLKSPYLNS